MNIELVVIIIGIIILANEGIQFYIVNKQFGLVHNQFRILLTYIGSIKSEETTGSEVKHGN